jgi:hypothetical protein
MENNYTVDQEKQLVIDFLKQNKRGVFTTEKNGKSKTSGVNVKFVDKKPQPIVELDFIVTDDFYKHRENLHRENGLKTNEQLFDFAVVNHGDSSKAQIQGVLQIFGKRIDIILRRVKYFSGKSGRRFDVSFFNQA